MIRPESPQTKAQEPPADLCAQVCRPAGPRRRAERTHSSAWAAASPRPLAAPFSSCIWRVTPSSPPAASAFQGWSQSGRRVSQPNGSLCPRLCRRRQAARRGPSAEARQTARPAPPCARSPVREVIPPAPLRPCSAHSRTPVRPGETTSLHASCSPRVLRAGPLPAPVGAPRRRPRPCGRRARSQTLQLGDAARGRAHRIPSYDLEEVEAAAGLTVDGELSRCHLRRCRASQVRREMPAGAPAAWRRADAGRPAPRPP